MTRLKMISLFRRRDALQVLVNEGDTELQPKLDQVNAAIEEGWKDLTD